MGIVPVYIATGAAAGLLRYNRGNGMEATEAAAISMLQDVCCLTRDDELSALILYYFKPCSPAAVFLICSGWQSRISTLHRVLLFKLIGGEYAGCNCFG